MVVIILVLVLVLELVTLLVKLPVLKIAITGVVQAVQKVVLIAVSIHV